MSHPFDPYNKAVFALHVRRVLTRYFKICTRWSVPCQYIFRRVLIPSPQTYVKGFAFDFQKVKKLVGATSDDDPAVEQMMYATMENFVDRENHWLCTAHTLDDEKDVVVVISLGEGSNPRVSDEEAVIGFVWSRCFSVYGVVIAEMSRIL